MPIFNYEGRNKAGEKISGSLKTDNLETLMIFLSERGIIPINITEQKRYKHFLYPLKIFPENRVGTKTILSFSRQMTTLLTAGMPIIKAINLIAKSDKNQIMKKVLSGIVEELESGNSLTKALQKYPNSFPRIFSVIIEVAENTGKLDEAFNHLAIFLEKQIANRKRVISTIRYPLIVIGFSLFTLAIVNIFVIPAFSKLYSGFKAQLPLPTIILINISNFLTKYWSFMLITLILSILGFFFLLKIPEFRLKWDIFKLKIPVIGNLQKRIILAQFSWTFSMVLHSAVAMLKGLNMIAYLTGNVFITQRILSIRDSIDHGETFTNAITKSELFDDKSIQLIQVGDETGKLEEMLTKLSVIYEEEVDYEIKNLNELLEPIILGIVGAIVLMLALGIYLPMWDIIKAIKN